MDRGGPEVADHKDFKDVRHQLGILAGRRGSWDVGYSKDRPKKWRPRTVIDPRSKEPFTDAGAKEFISCLLEDDHPLEEISLERPPGRKGYVMKVDTDEGMIYIKIELGSGKIIGRSFHYSIAR